MNHTVFVDCETTGLLPHRHEVWELALIERKQGDGGHMDVEHVFHVRPDLSLADPDALRISRFYDRTRPLDTATAGAPGPTWQPPRDVAATVARLLDGAHFVASNPAFDAAMIQRFLFRNAQAACWNYHLVDVRALALGYLHGQGHPATGSLLLTASSSVIGAAVGVGPLPDDVKHTALGDARWVRDVFDAVTAKAAAA